MVVYIRLSLTFSCFILHFIWQHLWIFHCIGLELGFINYLAKEKQSAYPVKKFVFLEPACRSRFAISVELENPTH